MRDSGVVRAFDPLKGFGFIRREKGKDVFFFYTEISEDDKLIYVGDIVSFEIKQMDKGPRAFDVKKQGSLTV